MVTLGIRNLTSTFVTVFARLSQPSEPVRCSRVALICSNIKRRGQTGQALNKYAHLKNDFSSRESVIIVESMRRTMKQ